MRHRKGCRTTCCVSAQREIRNAVVWIENAPPAPRRRRSQKVEIDQNGCAFIPRVVVVPAGGTVDFLNSDRLLHNIHATPKLNVSFNRTQPKDRTIPVTFAKPEIVRINCDLHSWMIGWVVVAAHRFYAVTGADGQFAFDNLPPGQIQAADLARAAGHRAGDRRPSATSSRRASPSR